MAKRKVRPWWYEVWRCRRAGKRDGRLSIPFNQEGYPAFVHRLIRDGTGLINDIVKDWQGIDKRLAGTERDLEDAKHLDAREAEAKVRGQLQIAEQEFEEVKHDAGVNERTTVALVIIFGGLVEVGVNYEALRYLNRNLPGPVNLAIAFLLSCFFMYMAELAGRFAKQQNWKMLQLMTGASLVGILTLAYFRGISAHQNQAAAFARGESTMEPISGLALFLVSVVLPLMLAAVGFAVGYVMSPTSEAYITRKRKLRKVSSRLG